MTFLRNLGGSGSVVQTLFYGLREFGTNVTYARLVHVLHAMRHVKTNHEFITLLGSKIFLTCRNVEIFRLQLHSKFLSFDRSH